MDDACAIIDALGAIGDKRAIPAVRPYASRTLLSRRRSGVEALRNLGDDEGLAAAVARAREQLPQPVRAAFDAVTMQNESDAGIEALARAVKVLDAQHQGLALDTLYEIGTPAAVAAVLSVLDKLEFARPYFWRYIKSIYKRSQLRHDPVIFGWLSHAIEARARKTTGTEAVGQVRLRRRPAQDADLRAARPRTSSVGSAGDTCGTSRRIDPNCMPPPPPRSSSPTRPRMPRSPRACAASSPDATCCIASSGGIVGDTPWTIAG